MSGLSKFAALCFCVAVLAGVDALCSATQSQWWSGDMPDTWTPVQMVAEIRFVVLLALSTVASLLGGLAQTLAKTLKGAK